MFARMLRWFARLLGIGMLVAAGYAAFHISKTWPRCVIDSDTRVLHFSADGNTIVTGHQAVVIGNYTGGSSDAHGKPPLKVWDTRSGRLVRTLLDDVEQFKRHDVCAKRSLIAVALDGTIRLADWQTGKEWSVDIGPGEIEWLRFGPNGDVLSVRVKEQPQPEQMIDVERGDVIHRFDSDARGLWFSEDGAYWRFSLKGRLHDWNVKTRKVERDYPVGIFYSEDRYFVYRDPDDVGFIVCDAASMDIKARIKPALPPEFLGRKTVHADPREKILACRHFAFSPSGRRVATFAQPFDELDGSLEIWETETGKRIAAFPELKRGGAWFHFENLLVFTDRSHTPRDALTIVNMGHKVVNIHAVVDIDAGKIVWRLPIAGIGRFCVVNERTVVHATPSGSWNILDLRTGERRQQLPHPYAADDLTMHLTFTKDRRYLYTFGKRREPALSHDWAKRFGRLLPEMDGRVQVLDTKTESIILDLATDACSGALISEDGQTLLVHDLGTIGFGHRRDEKTGHRSYFYELHSRRPWLWAFATPAALVILWLLWRTWRVRLRRNVPAVSRT